MSPRGLPRGQVNFRSHNSCLSLGAPSPGRHRACVLFGVFFGGGYSPTGLPGDTVWLALPQTGWGGLSVFSQEECWWRADTAVISEISSGTCAFRDLVPCAPAFFPSVWRALLHHILGLERWYHAPVCAVHCRSSQAASRTRQVTCSFLLLLADYSHRCGSSVSWTVIPCTGSTIRASSGALKSILRDP